MRALILKDIIRRWRSPVATLVMMLFPIVMSLLIGTVSGGSNSNRSFPTIKVFLMDLDDSLLGELLGGSAGNPQMKEYIDLVEVGEEGYELMEQGEASAMIVVPEGATDAICDGTPFEIEIVRNPTESIKPEIVEQGVLLLSTYLDLISKVMGSELAQMRDMMEADNWPELAQVTALSGQIFERALQMRRFAFPPSVQITDTKEESEGPSFNLYGYILAMVGVMAILFVASRSILDLYEEERLGVLRRQLSTPLTLSQLINAKLAFGVLFGFIVMALLLVFGAIFGWYRGSVDLLGVAVHTVAFSLAACGLMTVVQAFARTEKQAGILAWIVIMGMSILGGSMFPVAQMPEAMRATAHFTLNYWAIEGYLDLLVWGRTLPEMVTRSAVLVVIGVLTLAAGKYLLDRRLRGGM